MRARKTASFGRPYNYSGMVYAATPFPESVARIVDALEHRIGFRPDNCLLNYYESGNSTMGYHSDSNDDLEPGAGVSIVSVGSPRTILFRAKREKEDERQLVLETGSLLYMSPEVQDDWQHSIPADPVAGSRISLTFRLLKCV